MTELSTRPPSERDLPAGRSAELRARVMLHADAPRPRLSARIAPIVAAAAVLATAATVALLVQSPHTGQPGGQPTISDRTLAGRCHVPGARVLARFTDRFGEYAVLGKGIGVYDCYVGLDGSVNDPPGDYGSAGHGDPKSDASNPEPASAKDQVQILGTADQSHLRLGSGSDGAAQPLRELHRAFGTVAADVARVTVTWAGRPTVTAAIRGNCFAARYVDTDKQWQHSPRPAFTVRAYDGAGHLLRKVTQPGR